MSRENIGTVNGEPVDFLYEDGALKWTKVYETDKDSPKEGTISGDDVLIVTKSSENCPTYVVHSIATLSSSSDAVPVPDVELKQQHIESPPKAFLSKHLLRQLPPHLTLPPEDIHVIISSKSGTGKADAFFEETLKPVLTTLGLVSTHYQVLQTRSHDTINRFAKNVLMDRAIKGVKQTILLLSGDGGVVDILNGLGGGERMSTYIRPTLLVFPFGTGNALFHSLHPPPSGFLGLSISPLHTALSSLFNPIARPLPHFIAHFSSASLLTNEGRTATPLEPSLLYGCIVASYGFHSTLVADSDTADLRQYGDRRFQMVAAELLADPHRYKARLTFTRPLSDEHKADESRETPGTAVPFEESVVERTFHAYILCTLVSNLEKGFKISPASKPLDGRMRVIHFDSTDGKEIMEIMQQAYDGGKHVQRGDGVVGYEEVEAMQIDFCEEKEDGRWLRVCIDGLIVRVDEGGWMKVKKGRKGSEVLDIVL